MRKQLCLLILGLFHTLQGAEYNSDNVGSETKDIIFRDATFNPLSYKREAAKITNTDSPSFNYLKTSTPLTSTPSSGGFKPSSPPKVPPFRFIQSSQLQQTSPFLSYFQSAAHPATDIASQYLQTVPVTQYQVQTPTQLQYVATPTIAQYPFIKFQNTGAQYAGGNAGSEAAGSNAAASSSQYITSTQQSLTSGSSLGSASSNSQASLSSNTPAKQFALQQSSQALYSSQQQQPQQPFLTFYQIQPQAAASNFLYQQPNANYFLSQQPQQFFSFYPAHRFGLYSPVQGIQGIPQGTQLSYILPVTQVQGSQDSTSANEVKPSSEQKVAPPQQATSSTSSTFGTKV